MTRADPTLASRTRRFRELNVDSIVARFFSTTERLPIHQVERKMGLVSSFVVLDDPGSCVH